MRRTPGLFLLLLVLALGVYFAVDPKHTGRPAAEHDRGEEVLVTATMPEAAPADGGGEGPSLDGPTSLASDRSLNFRQRRNGTTSNGSLTDELDAEAQQPTSSSDPAAQPAAPPDLTHYEQYDIKLDSPHKAAKSVALADLQGSRKLLRDFSRFKRTTAEFLTASHRKAFNERLAPANQKRKNKRQVERAKLAAQAQPRGGATDWVTAISEATARPEIKLSGNLTDGASSGAPQRNSSFSEYLRLKNSDPQVVLAISKEYGCKDPDTGKMGTLFGRCPQMAVEEELNAARLKRDEDELVAAPPNGEKASDATTVKIEGSSLVVQRTPVPEEPNGALDFKLSTNITEYASDEFSQMAVRRWKSANDTQTFMTAVAQLARDIHPPLRTSSFNNCAVIVSADFNENSQLQGYLDRHKESELFVVNYRPRLWSWLHFRNKTFNGVVNHLTFLEKPLGSSCDALKKVKSLGSSSFLYFYAINYEDVGSLYACLQNDTEKRVRVINYDILRSAQWLVHSFSRRKVTKPKARSCGRWVNGTCDLWRDRAWYGTAVPSTGLYAILAAYHTCKTTTLFGFNEANMRQPKWKGGHSYAQNTWKGHDIYAEREIIKFLQGEQKYGMATTKHKAPIHAHQVQVKSGDTRKH